MTHPIPSPDFKGNQVMWHQPKREDILVDKKFAIMSQETFDSLMEYSQTNPTGIYDGKMWKSKSRFGHFFLKWYAPTDYLNSTHVCAHMIRIMDWKNLMGVE